MFRRGSSLFQRGTLAVRLAHHLAVALTVPVDRTETSGIAALIAARARQLSHHHRDRVILIGANPLGKTFARRSC
jgi:hypothetical protein